MQSQPLLETGRTDESTNTKLLWFILYVSEARQLHEQEGVDESLVATPPTGGRQELS
jgi:hypothetical protein